MGFFDGLLDFADAAATGVGTYFQAEDQRKQRERQQQIEDEDRSRAKELQALERMLLKAELDLKRKPESPSYRVTVDGMQGEFKTPDEAAAFRTKYDVPDPEPKPTGPRYSPVQTAEGIGAFDPATGTIRPTGVQPPPSAPRAEARPTEVQMRYGALLPRAKTALQTLEGALEQFGGNVPEATFLGRFRGGQYATPELEQTYNQAADALATAILRAESGAAITEDERRTYTRQFIPQPGEPPAVVRQKLQALHQTLDAMERLGGGATEMPPQDGAAAARTTPPAGATRPTWQTRADELRASGLDPSEIAIQLKREGLIR